MFSCLEVQRQGAKDDDKIATQTLTNVHTNMQNDKKQPVYEDQT